MVSKKKKKRETGRERERSYIQMPFDYLENLFYILKTSRQIKEIKFWKLYCPTITMCMS